MAKLQTTIEKIEFLTFSLLLFSYYYNAKGEEGSTPHICVPITNPEEIFLLIKINKLDTDSVTHHQKYQLIHSNKAKFNYTPSSCISLKLQFWISEVRRLLQHWIWSMLFRSYVYVPQTVINKKNLHQMAEGKDEKPTNPNNQLSDSGTSDDKPINPKLKTSVEERHYGIIPGLVLATQAALSHSWA